MVPRLEKPGLNSIAPAGPQTTRTLAGKLAVMRGGNARGRHCLGTVQEYVRGYARSTPARERRRGTQMCGVFLKRYLSPFSIRTVGLSPFHIVTPT